MTLRNINSKFCTFINNVSFLLLLLFFHFSSAIFQKINAQNTCILLLPNYAISTIIVIIILLFYYFYFLFFIILLFIGLKLSHCDIYPVFASIVDPDQLASEEAN